ncbi:ClpXP adapter SpxH family protein [Bacillus sp. 165]|uniref:ClpXP adapter SpxH family protein n=1 Tax=Bacillus sp. 165 TaxID=1529117 RepID=UPI001ADCFB4C|nr:ClpXP adapter SpxH family protein [Bacillus sp. 165]MBO9128640.1 DsbA family protein [Bacillus sp. 165]
MNSLNKITPLRFQKCIRKPIEAYLFIDPLCKDCWAIEPIIQKLMLEYGKYFTLRHILTGKIQPNTSHKWNKPANIRFVWEKSVPKYKFACEKTINIKHSPSPYTASIAIKAAELQGRKAGSKFLRKFQEALFLKQTEEIEEELLLKCAQKSGIDLEEFQKDIHSASATKAFQCDLKFSTEMHITEIPSLVFFHANSDEEGVKISGIYSYDVYVQVLKDIIKKELNPEPLPNFDSFLRMYDFFSTQEIAIIYSISYAEAERELKKLMLRGRVIPIPTDTEIYWRYLP